MRHGIVGAGGVVLVLALTVAGWIGGPAPADDVSATPPPSAVVLDLVESGASPTTTSSATSPAVLPDHLADPSPNDSPAPATIVPPTTTTVTSPPAPPTTAPVASRSRAEGPAFRAAVNAVRADRGLDPLAARAELDTLAQSWAEEMAATDDLRHSELIYDVIAGAWTTAGENIGYGPSVGVIVDALEASPGHLDNMVNPDFTSVGIGVVRVGDVLWTAHLFAG